MQPKILSKIEKPLLRQFAEWFLLIIIVAAVFGSVGYVNGYTTSCSKTLRLPIFHVGDYWVYKVTYNGAVYTWTKRIVSEEIVNGIYCYVEVTTSKPLLEDMIMMKEWISKSDLNIVKQMWIFQDSSVYVKESTHMYDKEMWPKAVGKKVNVTSKVSSYIIIGGITHHLGNTNQNYEIVMDSFETIAVPAGTFLSLKIYAYLDGRLDWIEWYSDRAKMWVRVGGSDSSGTIVELLHYRLTSKTISRRDYASGTTKP